MGEKTKALIVEDNAFMAEVLYDMLQAHAHEISVLGIAPTGKSALELIKAEKPDVVFLDIELPDMTGFSLLSQLTEINFKTIFTTAHSQYAIRAFRFNALDYLVKPIKEAELREALDRLDSVNNNVLIKQALINLESKVEEQKLVLITQKGPKRFLLRQITHIEGERNYSFIHLSDGSKELSSKTLAYFEEILEDKSFFRCHRSYLVNKHHIALLKQDNFVLKNDLGIPISRRKKTIARNWFM